MIVYGHISDVYQTPDGPVISIQTTGVGSDEELDRMMHETRLEVEIRRPKRKRTLTANAYFWVLTQEIARRLKTDLWDQYLEQIKNYGQFIDCAVVSRAVDTLQTCYRYTEVMETGMMNGEPAAVVRCYRGSSTYTVEEMGYLIDGTVQDAKDLGIDVLPEDEIRHLVEVWRGSFGELQ